MGKEGESGPKNYVAEKDVIDSRAEEALVILADKDNTVYVDLKMIREESRNPKNPLRNQHTLTLNWLNKHMREYPIPSEDGSGRIGGIRTVAGGKVMFTTELPRDAIYITNDPAKANEHHEMGRKWDYPEFLRYSTEPLFSGLMDLNYNGPKNPTALSIDDLAEGLNVRRFYPHQFVRVNDGILYAIEQKVVETNEGSERFRLTGKPTARRIPYEFPINCVIPGFEPRGLEQRIAFYQLTHPDTEICIVTGGAGSGKTVVPYVAALQLILGNEKLREAGKLRRQIRLYMPGDIVGGPGREVGFLKGDLDEKTAHVYEAWRDTHEELGLNKYIRFEDLFIDPEERKKKEKGEDGRGEDGKGEKPAKRAKSKISDGSKGLYLPSRSAAIRKGHLPFEKGRTFTGVVIVADESEDWKPEEGWMLATRGGSGTKTFFTGDVKQVKNPKLSEELNAIVYIAHRIREGEGHPRASIINLGGSNRNQTAEIIGSKRPPMIV